MLDVDLRKAKDLAAFLKEKDRGAIAVDGAPRIGGDLFLVEALRHSKPIRHTAGVELMALDEQPED